MLLMEEAGLSVNFRVSVGQGFKEKSGGVGCGRCTRGFAACIDGCPPGADEIFDKLAQIRRAQ
jgi:ferredoxin